MTLHRFSKLLVVVGLLMVMACGHPPFSLNYRDKIGRKQGNWKVWFDEGKSKLYYEGKYKNNAPRGAFKYYDQRGNIQLIEKYKRNKSIQTTYYHPNGKVDMKGLAQIIINPDTTIYHWIDQWEKFDTAGKLIEVHTYRNGNRIWVKFVR